MSSRFLQLVLCAGLITSSTNVARAQSAAPATADAERLTAARRLFDQGVADADAGRWWDAADNFERAYTLKPSPEIRYNLASALAKVGRLTTAAALLQGLARADEASPAVQEAARTRLGQVAPRLAHVTIAHQMQPGDFLYLDGRPLERAETGTALAVDPGSHLMQARLTDGRIFARRVVVDEGVSRVVSVDTINEDAATRADAPLRPRSVFHRPWFWVAVAGVAAGTAAALTLPHLRDKDVSGNVDTWHVD